ncbi:MAG TPA: DUF2182 domain-containing protein [Mycobacterium sp.]|nr:DUF2182 domain-containing protein [Mycobacterium sp.]
MSTAVVATRARLRGLTRTRPGWWLSGAAGLAWAALIFDAVTGPSHTHARMAGPTMPMHDMVGMAMPGMAMPAINDASPAPGQLIPDEALDGLTAWSGHWLLMVVAMMWPLYAVSAAAVGRASFRRWRAGTVTAYIGAITVLWLAVGILVRACYQLLGSSVPATLWSTAWLLVGAAATWSVWRARLLRTCNRLGVIAPAGWRGLRSAASCGLRSWPRCALLCGPVMLAMVAAHSLPLMIGGSAAVWWEQRHPRAWRDPVPVVVLAATAVGLVVAAAWPGH